MKWVHLIHDNWLGNNAHEATVADPTWQVIEAVIRALNGNERTGMNFAADDGREFVVGGGPQNFIVYVAYNDEEMYTLKDRKKPDRDIEVTTGGQTGIFSEQEVWDLTVALKAARHFYGCGRHDPSLPWEKVGG
jgi:hypothetical protein